MTSRKTIKPGATPLRALLFSPSRWLRLALLAAIAVSTVTPLSSCRNDQAIIDRHEKALDEDDE